MEWIRQLLSYAITIAIIIALVVIVPRFARLRVAPNYNDIEHLVVEQSLNADTGVAFASLAIGDPIAYRLGDQEGKELCVGWIAALPGDEVAVRDKSVMVNGKKAGGGAVEDAPPRAPVMIPAGHCYVVSSFHQLDSVAYGPIPAAAIRARLSSLP